MIQNSCPFGELSSAFPRHFQGDTQQRC
jgi:hypothetical protein